MNVDDDFGMLPTTVTFVDNRLCYNEKDCHLIPQSLMQIYGSKVRSLDISYNQLVSIRGVEDFNNIEELILDNNQLTDLIRIPHLPHLHTLSLNKNKLEDLSALILQISSNLPNIIYLSLLGNKVCPNGLSSEENDEKDYQRYRYYVLYHLPNLKFLDSRRVTAPERHEAKRRGKFMNVIKPSISLTNLSETGNSSPANDFNPLPKTVRPPDDCIGAYGKCKYRYSGKHSEGNRFISNSDL